MPNMKIDLYTKFILTVIAGCLICFIFRDVEIVASARAEEEPGQVMSINIAQVNGRPVKTIGVPVVVLNQAPLPRP
jgi:hypothetical protein